MNPLGWHLCDGSSQLEREIHSIFITCWEYTEQGGSSCVCFPLYLIKFKWSTKSMHLAICYGKDTLVFDGGGWWGSIKLSHLTSHITISLPNAMVWTDCSWMNSFQPLEAERWSFLGMCWQWGKQHNCCYQRRISPGSEFSLSFLNSWVHLNTCIKEGAFVCFWGFLV